MSALFSLIGSAAEWSWRTGRILWYNGLLGAMAGSERSVLNVGPGDDEDPSRKHRPAEVVALELQKFMLKLKGIFMDENGRGVDYKTLKESSEFAEYREKCKELRGVDLSSLSKNEKMSFFLSKTLLPFLFFFQLFLNFEFNCFSMNLVIKFVAFIHVLLVVYPRVLRQPSHKALK